MDVAANENGMVAVTGRHAANADFGGGPFSTRNRKPRRMLSERSVSSHSIRSYCLRCTRQPRTSQTGTSGIPTNVSVRTRSVPIIQ